VSTTVAPTVIERFGLRAHPEGGWFAETWRADAPEGERPTASAILYLLAAGESSHWHRVDAAEIWQYSAGDALELRVWAGGATPVATYRLGSGEDGGKAAAGRCPGRRLAGRSAAGGVDTGRLHREPGLRVRRIRARTRRLGTPGARRLTAACQPRAAYFQEIGPV